MGIAMLAIGLIFYVASLRAVMRAYNAETLVTGGVYGCCRHPLYASWVVFIAPGIALLLGSWIVLTTPVFMYFALRALVKKEEVYLESVFGDGYRAYLKNTPCIIPLGWMRPDKKSA
jgi:protein-S-isoprenylcysteine O-methyltransferase Ste14